MTKFLPAGDCALIMEFGNTVSEVLNRKVKGIYDALQNAPVAGVTALTPTFRSLLVEYDPCLVSFADLQNTLTALENNLVLADTAKKRIVYIPVCYGGAFGEDIADVAAHTGLSEKEIIERHAGRDYLIYMLGFLPGFAYLGGLDEKLHTPRLKNPRTKIPAGSVGIGGEQTGIYPLASPGGWRLIGRTPVRVYDALRAEPFLYAAGDYIRFVPVSEREYETILAAVEKGDYTPRTEVR